MCVHLVNRQQADGPHPKNTRHSCFELFAKQVPLFALGFLALETSLQKEVGLGL